MLKRYTPSTYAADYCHNLVCTNTVRNWIKKWVNCGGLPEKHSIEKLPNGRSIIVVNDTPEPKSNKLVNLILSNKRKG